jgi:hypothetical protein
VQAVVEQVRQLAEHLMQELLDNTYPLIQTVHDVADEHFEQPAEQATHKEKLVFVVAL